MSHISTTLREKYPEDKLYILAAKRNAGSFTYDGIETGGERVTSEIEETLEELSRRGQKIKKLSIVGYSLGGLVSRYAIGLLYSKGWFEKLEPVNFTTFATPHLGVRTPLLGYHNHIWNVLGARTLSMSGRQLFMIDSFRDTQRPLLSVLADSSSIFVKALACFKTRTLYSNVVNDRSATYYTTGISRIDPYVDLSSININYLKGYEPIIVDAENAVSPKSEEVLPSFYKRLPAMSKNILRKIPIVVFLVIFIPIASTLFLINAGVQTFKSRRRIRLHEEGRAGIGTDLYRIPLMVNDVRRTAEDVFENINSAQSQEYLPIGTEEVAAAQDNVSPGTSTEEDGSLLEKSESPRKTNKSKNVRNALDFPTLALSPPQFAMIQALDEVGWKKYPVYIHNDRHSHAAIIVRWAKKSFDEGKVVVKHWVDNFEI